MTSYKAARMPSTDCTSAGLAFGQSGCAAMELGGGALAVCASTGIGVAGRRKQRRAVRIADVRVMRGKVAHAARNRRIVLRQKRLWWKSLSVTRRRIRADERFDEGVRQPILILLRRPSAIAYEEP